MRSRFRKLVLGVLLLVFAASLIANWGLYHWSISKYREMKQVRLDPMNEDHYAAANGELGTAPAGTRRLVFAGDSNLELWSPLPAPAGYLIVNRGISSETTRQLRLRFERDVLRLAPQTVLLAAGNNDLSAIAVLPEQAPQIEADCVQNLRFMVDQCRQHNVPRGGDDLCSLPAERGVEPLRHLVRRHRAGPQARQRQGGGAGPGQVWRSWTVCRWCRSMTASIRPSLAAASTATSIRRATRS